jgi:hypothetical protein
VTCFSMLNFETRSMIFFLTQAFPDSAQNLSRTILLEDFNYLSSSQILIFRNGNNEWALPI